MKVRFLAAALAVAALLPAAAQAQVAPPSNLPPLDARVKSLEDRVAELERRAAPPSNLPAAKADDPWARPPGMKAAAGGCKDCGGLCDQCGGACPCPTKSASAKLGGGDKLYLMVGASTSITDPRVTDLSGPRAAFALVKDGTGPSGREYHLDRSAAPGKTWLDGKRAESIEDILTWVQPRWAAGDVYATERDGGWAFTSTGGSPKAPPPVQLWSVPGRPPMTEDQLRALYPTMRFPHDPEPASPFCLRYPQTDPLSPAALMYPASAGGSCANGACAAPTTSYRRGLFR